MPRVTERVGTYFAVIEVQPPGTAKLVWKDEGGRELSRVPKHVIKTYPERYREVRKKLDSIRNTLKVQTKRIESFYVDDPTMPYEVWREHYAEHKLVKSISESLIWQFRSGSRAHTAILRDGELVAADGSRLPTLARSTRVSLWHPLHSDGAEGASWRRYIGDHAVAQPFRQAYREVYRPGGETGLNEVLSGLYVRQHQFRALLLKTGWRYQFRGRFHSESTPVLACPGGMRCEIGIGNTSSSVSQKGICLGAELDGFQFYRGEKQLPAEAVPPLLHSEVLRDIDLATAVSGIGYRGDWDNIETLFSELGESKVLERLASAKGWTLPAFARMVDSHPLGKAMVRALAVLDAAMERKPIPETVKTRGLLLEAMLRVSPQADRTRVQGRYVYVDGARGSYRINLSSGLVFDCKDNTLVGVGTTRARDNEDEVETDTLLTRIHETIVELCPP
ncbi:MAG: DUF4132 domain-containing protein [Thermoanaerobaculia bacterium]|nr:DUF4132 domain-containing protein [Thermoanaerobaculia bacterium]